MVIGWHKLVNSDKTDQREAHKNICQTNTSSIEVSAIKNSIWSDVKSDGSVLLKNLNWLTIAVQFYIIVNNQCYLAPFPLVPCGIWETFLVIASFLPCGFSREVTSWVKQSFAANHWKTGDSPAFNSYSASTRALKREGNVWNCVSKWHLLQSRSSLVTLVHRPVLQNGQDPRLHWAVPVGLVVLSHEAFTPLMHITFLFWTPSPQVTEHL